MSTQIDYSTIPTVTQIGEGKFVLQHELGRGGKAVVWKAVEVDEPKRDVAVKVITCAFDSSERNAVLEQFENEARIWSQFQRSPHVVQLYYTFRQKVEVSGPPLLAVGFVMEFSPEKDLEHVLGKGRSVSEVFHYDAIQIRRFLLDIALALKTGHDLGVIHRDIKASNVIIFQDGTLKVPKMMDFGIAWPLERGPAGFSGTPQYMAPEVFAKQQPTAASDIYSLGVLFYQVLTGALPYDFSAATSGDKTRLYARYAEAHKQGGADFSKLEAINDRLQVLVQRMMSVAPQHRPNVGWIIRSLEAQLDNEVITLRTATPPPTVAPNTYRWHPKIHECVGDKLIYYFIKGRSPVGDPSWIGNNLRERGVTGFSIYRIVGGYDYILRVWVNSLLERQVVETLADFRTFHHGNAQRFDVKKIYLLSSNRVEGMFENLTVDKALGSILAARNDDQSVEFKQLANQKFVLGNLSSGKTIQTFALRVFLTVQANGRPAEFFTNVCAMEFAKALLAEKKLVRDVSVYRGDGDIQFLLKFRLRRFQDLAPVYNKYLGIAAIMATENFILSSQTFIELTGFEEVNESARLVESDDGSILSALNRFLPTGNSGNTFSNGISVPSVRHPAAPA